MKHKLFTTFILCFFCLSLLVGCTGEANDTAGIATNSDYAGTSLYDDYSYKDYEDYDESSGDYYESEADIIKTQSMIAREASLSVDVEKLEDFDTSVKSYVDEYNGYFEKADIQNYDSEYSCYRYGYYTVRIPADKLDAFLGVMDENAIVTEKNVSSEDITLDYVDNEAKIKNLIIERDNLQQLLEVTTEVSDMIQIQDRLSNLQSTLDSYQAQKRYMEGRVAYSKVEISAREEREIEHPVKAAFEINFVERVIEGMSTAVDVFVTLLVGIPVVTVVTAFTLLFVWIVKKIIKKIFKDRPRAKYIVIKEDDDEE